MIKLVVERWVIVAVVIQPKVPLLSTLRNVIQSTSTGSISMPTCERSLVTYVSVPKTLLETPILVVVPRSVLLIVVRALSCKVQIVYEILRAE